MPDLDPTSSMPRRPPNDAAWRCVSQKKVASLGMLR
jgi:hypothetical protein